MPIAFKKDLIYNLLKQKIQDNRLVVGSRLPCEKDLAKELNVGQITLRNALSRLESENLVERIPGKGTFIASQIERKTFLLIYPDYSEDIALISKYVLLGVQNAAEENSITLERCPLSVFNDFSDVELNSMIKQNSITGIIFETGHSQIEIPIIRKIESLNLPTVIPHGLHYDVKNSNFLVLRTDERSAFKSALSYLQSMGHKRVGVLRLILPYENSDIIRGFSESDLSYYFEINGFDNDLDLIKSFNNNDEELKEIIKQWIFSNNSPTAIMCHSDRIAMRVYKILKDFDVKIPEQLSIMGYSNYPGSKLLLPSLSTVDINYEKCGKISIEKLLNSDTWYQNANSPRDIYTPFNLLKRNSIYNLNKS